MLTRWRRGTGADGVLTGDVCPFCAQDKAQVLADVRQIISTQLGTEIEKVGRCPGRS